MVRGPEPVGPEPVDLEPVGPGPVDLEPVDQLKEPVDQAQDDNEPRFTLTKLKDLVEKEDLDEILRDEDVFNPKNYVFLSDCNENKREGNKRAGACHGGNCGGETEADMPSIVGKRLLSSK